MDATIQLLSEEIINKIAAGEVIENPASVVKELVENALDAKAKNIVVSIQGGGLNQIVVEDDGLGMSQKDLILSLKRHATSKMQSFEDLQKILTMGFRGEALASIAAISKMKIETSNSLEACALSVEKGKIISKEPVARNQGTTIIVSNLFFNVPVRKKFQKSLSANVAQITRMMISLALSHPSVCFTYLSQNKTLLSCPVITKNASIKVILKDRIEKFFGKDFLSSLRFVDLKEKPMHLFGFIGLPSFAKKTKKSQFLFLNNRSVTSSFISEAIKLGYGTRIKEMDYPSFILHLQMDASLVDINVHPQKTQIRLQDPLIVQGFLQKAISSTLQKELPFSIDLEPKFIHEEVNTQVAYSLDLKEKEKFLEFEQKLLFGNEKTENLPSKKMEIKIIDLLGSYLLIDAKSIQSRLFLSQDALMSGLIVVDLLATYARCLFDSFADIFNNDSKVHPSQELAFPSVIELTSDNMILIEEQKKNLQKMGIFFRVLSENSIAIDSIPDFMSLEDVASVVEILLEDLLLSDNKKTKELWIKKLAQKICRFAKSKKRDFCLEEAKHLFYQLMETKDPYRDPLGEATMIHCGKSFWQSLFKKQRV